MSSKHNTGEKLEKVLSKNKSFLYAKFQRSSEVPSIILFLIKVHIVKDEESARKLIVFIILLILIISAYLIFKGTSSPIFIDKINR